MMKSRYLISLCSILLLVGTSSFSPSIPFKNRVAASARIRSGLSASTLPDANEMKASALREELQSYDISTKSFFEKSELVNAVKKARSEGKKPKAKAAEKKATKKDSKPKEPKGTRSERLAEEIEKCKKLKVGDLKRELESLGISTKSFFEKTEFVRAVAEARVDGKKGKGGATEEKFDPSYRDVVMQKMAGNSRPAFDREPIIDVKLGRL